MGRRDGTKGQPLSHLHPLLLLPLYPLPAADERDDAAHLE